MADWNVQQTNSSESHEGRADSLSRLRKFLFMGTESNLYRPLAKGQACSPNPSQTSCIQEMIQDGSGEQVVKEITHFGLNRHSVRPDAIIFALAITARCNDIATKQAAYAAIREVCRSSLELFHFVDYAEKMSHPNTGWGRAQRIAISKWYNQQDPKQLAIDVTKFVSRMHWSHRDLFRLSHIKPANNGLAAIIKYIIKGIEETKKEFNSEDDPHDMKGLLNYLQAVHDLKHTTDPQLAARLLETHPLEYEHVPTVLLKNKEVWLAILQKSPVSLLLKRLPQLSVIGMFEPGSPHCTAIVEKIQNESVLQEAKIHPLDVLIALRTYELGKRERVKKRPKWVPNPNILEVLNHAFSISFKFIEPTNKRILIAVDVRNPMVHDRVVGCNWLSPAVVTATMLMCFARSEPNLQIVAFSLKELLPLEITTKITLDEVCKRMRETPMGPVNCIRPIIWATEQRKPFDAFLIFTDNQTKAGEVLPADALRQYRELLNIPQAKLIVCALGSKGFNLASPQDPNMLDIAGFDTSLPRLIHCFIQGIF